MTEERALKIALALQNIGYQVDDETLKKIKPFKDEIEAEILQEIEEDKSASAIYNKALDDFMNNALEMIKNEQDTRYGYLDGMDIREIAEELKIFHELYPNSDEKERSGRESLRRKNNIHPKDGAGEKGC